MIHKNGIHEGKVRKKCIGQDIEQDVQIPKTGFRSDKSAKKRDKKEIWFYTKGKTKQGVGDIEMN